MTEQVQQRLVELRNELKAQKVYSGLTYSQLLLPDNTPEESFSGTASLSGSGSDPIARLCFRFTRTDGSTEPPLVNFTMSANLNPTYKQFAEANGFTFVDNNMSYMTLRQIEGYIGGIGDGYVDFFVDYGSYIRTMFFSLNSIDFTATVQAIANVQGTLVVERII